MIDSLEGDLVCWFHEENIKYLCERIYIFNPLVLFAGNEQWICICKGGFAGVGGSSGIGVVDSVEDFGKER